MRFACWWVACLLARAQNSDPAYGPLSLAYEALRARDYDAAVASFQRAIQLAPSRAAIRKDLGYAYLKVGETELARDQFLEAMRLEPGDTQVALEYAFLCFETKQPVTARRIFDRLGRAGNQTAAQAFENIDRPLREGLERWRQAIAMGSDNFSTHYDLATLAEQRDELETAAAHFEKAWRLQPDRRSVLVDLGRVLQSLKRAEEANAALLAASRSGNSRAAEMARELLPDRYPYVSDFQRALTLDPANTELRRELGYLLLKMDRPAEAEEAFRELTRIAPEDLLSATQLGFLLYGRGLRAAAQPLFDRVLAGKDEDLANRVRAVLRIPQVLRPRAGAQPAAIDAKLMAERSIKAGYMKDALRYLQMAHEADPVDFGVMLKLGWTYNMLKQDEQAARWFDLGRKAPDPLIATEAGEAYRNLHAATARYRTTAWLFPVFSSRWRDVFAYGQVKTELRTGLPFRPYLSVRFIGDTRRTVGEASPQHLSESSFILGAGVSSRTWHGGMLWGEAGTAIDYLNRHMLPDYRGGLAWFRSLGHGFGAETSGWFADFSVDGLLISRFGNDFISYTQQRAGWTAVADWLRTQIYWNGAFTFDSKREYWANYSETGPGIRFRADSMPPSMYFTVNLLRGAYLINAGNPRRPNFSDLRAGVWYAFTR